MFHFLRQNVFLCRNRVASHQFTFPNISINSQTGKETQNVDMHITDQPCKQSTYPLHCCIFLYIPEGVKIGPWITTNGQNQTCSPQTHQDMPKVLHISQPSYRACVDQTRYDARLLKSLILKLENIVFIRGETGPDLWSRNTRYGRPDPFRGSTR